MKPRKVTCPVVGISAVGSVSFRGSQLSYEAANGDGLRGMVETAKGEGRSLGRVRIGQGCLKRKSILAGGAADKTILESECCW